MTPTIRVIIFVAQSPQTLVALGLELPLPVAILARTGPPLTNLVKSRVTEESGSPSRGGDNYEEAKLWSGF